MWTKPKSAVVVILLPVSAVLITSCGGGGSSGGSASTPTVSRLQVERPSIQISQTETQASPQLEDIGGFDVFAKGITGSGINVAVLDTGIMANHPEFGNRVRPGDDFQGDGDGTTDGNGHGTHAASLLAAANDGEGMLGIAPEATIYSYRILNDRGIFGGRSGNQMVPSVLGQTGQLDVSVVNNSWSSIYEINDLGKATIEASLPQELAAYRGLATPQGSIMVWAAGNGADSEVSVRSGLPYHFPELEPNWLTVVATDINGKEPRYTNQCGIAAAWCVTAPGGGDDQLREGLIGAAIDGDYTRKSGTSMAAPIVSGALAVLMDRFPGMTPREARSRLIASASLEGLTTATGCTLATCGEASMKQVFGHGMINLGAALQPISAATLVTASGEAGISKTLIQPPLLTGPAMRQSLSGAVAVIRDSFDGQFFSLPVSALLAESPRERGYGLHFSRHLNGLYSTGPVHGGHAALFAAGGGIPAEYAVPARMIDIPASGAEAWAGYAVDLGGPWMRFGFGSGQARQSLHLMLADQHGSQHKGQQGGQHWFGLGGDTSSRWLDGGGTGGLAPGQSHSTWAFGGVQYPLGDVFLTAEGLMGRTTIEGDSGSLIEAGQMDFDSARLRLSSGQVPEQGWSVAVELPPALRDGWIDIQQPQTTAPGGIDLVPRRYDLDLDHREWRGVVTWARQTDHGLHYRLQLSHSLNDRHVQGSEETAALISLTLPF